jgi:hypothetical protein
MGKWRQGSVEIRMRYGYEGRNYHTVPSAVREGREEDEREGYHT